MLRLTLGDAPVNTVRVPTALMDRVPGLDGVWWVQLPCAHPEAPTCTRLIVGGLAGSKAPQASVPHDVHLHLLEGVLSWWQTSYGHDTEGNKVYRKHKKGDVLTLTPGEEHGFVALEDFLCYNTFFPCFPE